MRALLVAVAAAASTCVGITAAQVAVAPPAGAAPVLAPTIDPFNKTSVSDGYKASLAAAREVPVGWTGNVATCTKGTETQASQDATASAVNFFRALNGLPPITMDPALHSQALAAALMMDAANDLNHTPDEGWPCYTPEGKTGAGAGSLSQAPAARAIESYMVDPGDKNFFAGHRRQILYPPSTTFGTGSTTDYNALPYGAFGARPAGVNWIAWPSAGYVPKALVTGRFSLSSNVNPDADYSAATVSVQVAGSSLPVTVHPQVEGYGDHTLTWEVTLPAGFATAPGDVKFDITVSGMKTHAGAAIPQRVYSSWAFTGLPGEATGLNATYDGTFATLSWNHPGFDGGATITGYRITPYINGVAQPSGVYGNANVQIFGGLVKGASYTWKVQAINSAGTGAQSAASNAISTGAGTSGPAAPTGVTAVAGDGEATVSWTAPSATGGASITGYLITPYIGAAAQPTTFSSGSGTSKVVTGLTNGSTYTFRIYAFNSTGNNSVNSDPSNAVTPHVVTSVPGAPTGVSATAGNAQATVSWTAPASNGGSAITGYKVTPFIGASAQPTQTFASTATSQTITGLTNGTAYTFKVAAVNAIGTGAQSAASSSVTPATVPGAPTGVSATAGNAQATVSWTAPASNGGSAITGYKVTPFIGASAQPTQTFNSTATSQTVTGLTNGTAYTFKVAAVNAKGTGVQSAASNTVTPTAPVGVPGAPTGVSATPGNQLATVSWTAPASNGGSAITGYKVTPFIGADAQATQTFVSTATTQTALGLTNGTAYTFKVAAVNAVGTGAMSSASNSVTPATLPGAPTAVSATAGNAEATVSWTAPASNGGSAITGYKVTPFIGAAAQTTRTFASTATSQTVTGLTNGTAYTFKVAAMNAMGTGPQSSASNGVIPTGPTIPYLPFSSWSAFVNRQYVDLTTKSPSASSLSSWVSQLDSGAKTKGDLDDALRRGSENLANVDPVVRIYRAFLGRSPDAGGLKFWINRKRAVAPARTWNVTQIATEFTKSNEFVTKYGGLTNRQWVTQIYTDVLGRTADQAGVNYWTNQLDTKRKTKAQVMVGFSESNEYKTKQAQNTDVSVAYIFLMGRAPTSAEASDWVTRQKAGTTHAALLTELLNSAKYATHITG